MTNDLFEPDPNDDDDDFVVHDSLMDFVLALRPRQPLPKLFYSEETDEPFAQCIDCERPLLTPSAADAGDENATPFYQLQKVIVRNESVFEYAMCLDCCRKLEAEFSQETREALQNFAREHVDAARFSSLDTDAPDAWEQWLAACFICSRPRSECHRYSIVGFGNAGDLVIGVGPFMLCDECEGRFGELVSEQTRKTWDRFVEDHFDSPPGVEADGPVLQPMLL